MKLIPLFIYAAFTWAVLWWWLFRDRRDSGGRWCVPLPGTTLPQV